MFHRMVSAGRGPDDDDSALRRELEKKVADFGERVTEALVLTDDKKFADDLRELCRLSRLIFHEDEPGNSRVVLRDRSVEQKTDALKAIDEYSDNCLTWLSHANAISSYIETECFRVKTKKVESKSESGVKSALGSHGAR